MHKTLGQRDPALAFPLAHARDDAGERRQANRAVAVSAIGLGATGLGRAAAGRPDWFGRVAGRCDPQPVRRIDQCRGLPRGHSWLDALSSAGALVGLVAVAFGQSWGDPVAGPAVTAFICHVGFEVTRDVVHRLADGVDPDVITTAEAAAGSVPGVIHAHARARWTGRTLRVEIEGWVDPELTVKDADAVGRQVAGNISRQLPEAGSFTWTSRAAPA
jgi:hypothetical protein